MLKESNRIIENTIRQIRESQAEKEKTRDVRQQLEEFKAAVDEGNSPAETKSEESRIAELDSLSKKNQDQAKDTAKNRRRRSPCQISL